MGGCPTKNKQTKGYYHCDRLSSPVTECYNFPERRCTTQHWQSVGWKVGSAFFGQVGKKKALYVSLCCFINWVSPEKLAELVPQADLALFHHNCREEINTLRRCQHPTKPLAPELAWKAKV